MKQWKLECYERRGLERNNNVFLNTKNETIHRRLIIDYRWNDCRRIKCFFCQMLMIMMKSFFDKTAVDSSRQVRKRKIRGSKVVVHKHIFLIQAMRKARGYAFRWCPSRRTAKSRKYGSLLEGVIRTSGNASPGTKRTTFKISKIQRQPTPRFRPQETKEYTKLQARNPKGKERERKRRENTIIEYELYSTIG